MNEQSIFNQPSTEAVKEGIRMVVYAQEKVGKTSFACGAPNAALFPLEVGYADVPRDKVFIAPMVKSYKQMLYYINDALQLMEAGEFPHQSIIIDSGTSLEQQLEAEVLLQEPNAQNRTMNRAHGGYGNAYKVANPMFIEFLDLLDRVASYGVHVIITAHAFAATVADPTAGDYDQWDLQLHSPKNNKDYGKRELLSRWADVIGFIYEPVFAPGSGGDDKDAVRMAVSANKGRVMGVSRTPNYVAGSRYNGLVGEIELANNKRTSSWNSFAEALFAVRPDINLYNATED